MGPGLYEWEANEKFVEWLRANPTSEGEVESSIFVAMIYFSEKLDFHDKCLNFVTILDNITWKDVYNVEMDEFESLINEKDVCPSFRLVKTLTGTKVVTDEFQGVVKDWNSIPNEAPHVRDND